MKKTVLIILMICFSALLFSCNNNQNVIKVNYLVAVQNGKYGVIDATGQEILPFDYHYLSSVSKEGVMVHQLVDDSYELINIDKQVLASGFDSLLPIIDPYVLDESRLLPMGFTGVKNGERYIYDSQGEFFSQSSSHFMMYTLGYLETMQYRVKINHVSKTIVNHYDWAYQTADDVYYARKDGVSYIVNAHGQVIASHDNVTFTMSHLDSYIVINTTHIYVYNSRGTLIYIDTDDVSVYPQSSPHFLNNYFTVLKNNQYGLMDEDGNFLINLEYDEISYKNEQFVIASKDGYDEIYYQFSKINTVQGINKMYGMQESIYDDRYILVYTANDYAYYYKGNQEIGGPYLRAYAFNELGYAVVQLLSEAYAIIDMNFQVVHQVYDDYQPFGNYFVVQQGVFPDPRLYGLIDHAGNFILPVENEQINIVNDTLQIKKFINTSSQLLMYIIDDHQTLRLLTDFTLTELTHHISQNRLAGFINNIIPYYFDHLSLVYPQVTYDILGLISDQRLIVMHNGKVGVVDEVGNIIIPFDYEAILGYA